MRAMPNIEFYAPWFRSVGVNRCMPHEQWLRWSPQGGGISRYVAAAPGETVLGAGFDHPRAKEREAFLEQQAAEVGADAADRWWSMR